MYSPGPVVSPFSASFRIFEPPVSYAKPYFSFYQSFSVLAAREEVYLYFTTGGGADFFTLMTELEARRRYRPEAPAAPTAGAHPVLDMHTAAETAGVF